MQSLNQQKSPLPIAGLPVNCCGPAGSPGPLGSIATLSAFNHHKVIENDTISNNNGRYTKSEEYAIVINVRLIVLSY